MSRLRRHNRRLLPPRPPRVAQSLNGEDDDDLVSRTCCEQLTFLDGRRKYVCAAFGQSEDNPLLSTPNHTDYGALRAGKRKGSSLLSVLLDVFNEGSSSPSARVSPTRGSLVAGCLTTVVRIAALLLSRSLCEGAWPALQVLSICTLPLGALKQLVSPCPSPN